MNRPSLAAPFLLIALGALFLFRNLYPEIPLGQYAATYWPYLLILWGALRAGEILFWTATAKPVPARGISPGEWLVVVFLCIFGAGMHAAMGWSDWWANNGFAAGGLEIFGEPYEYPISAEKPSSKTPHIVIEDYRGSARITGGDVDEVKVTGHKTIRSMNQEWANRAAQDSPVELMGDQNRIVLRTNQNRGLGRARVDDDLDITVPKGAAIEAQGRGGDFGLSNIAGAVELKGRGSDVDLQDVGGPVTIEGTYTGVLEFRNLGAHFHFTGPQTSLDVEKIPGQVRMVLGNISGTDLDGPVHLSVRSRDVVLTNFTNALDLSVQRGDIQLQPGVLPLARIDARTHAGDIELSLPAAAKFDLSASTERGEIANDFGSPLLLAPTGRHGAVLRGSTGAGPSVMLETDRGTVTVRKSAPAEESQAPAKGSPAPLKKIEQ